MSEVEYLGSTQDGERYSADQLTGNVFEDMAAFDRKYGFDEVTMTPRFLAFRMMFLVEELTEAIEAVERDQWASFVDAMIDLIVVAAGTLSIAGVDGQKAWNEVRRANMQKVRRANPTRSNSGGADLCKPDGWVAPSHTDNVGDLPLLTSLEFGRYFPHSITVLFECIGIQVSKYEDYNAGSSARSDYWIHGISDLEYEMNKKLTRFKSVLSKIRRGEAPRHESVVDSLQDDVNYHAFAIAWLRGREPGQNLQLNLFGE